MLKEIRKITSNLDAKLQIFKIKAHQDDVKHLSDLSFAERENVAFDLAAKTLIHSTGLEAFPFPFYLSSINISTRHYEIMSMHSSLYHHTSLPSSSKHLAHKLQLSRADVVDWKSRIMTFKKSRHIFTHVQEKSLVTLKELPIACTRIAYRTNQISGATLKMWNRTLHAHCTAQTQF